jgi:hypothetical protein
MTTAHPAVLSLAKDLSKEPPRSPRVRIGGFALLARAIDKCRAYLAGTLGEYSHGCPVDMVLLDYKKVTLGDFRERVALGASDEEIGEWLTIEGRPMSADEIKAWSDELESRGFFERLEASDAVDFPAVA